MPPKFEGKWGIEYLNNRFPMPAAAVSGKQREADFCFKFYTVRIHYNINRSEYNHKYWLNYLVKKIQ